jgi:RND superfamily putative drug exporter
MRRFLCSASCQLLIFLTWTLLALGALPLASAVNQQLDASTTLKGSESAEVAALLQQRFNSPFAKIALLRIVGAPSPRTLQGKKFLEAAAEVIRHVPGVAGVMSYADRDDSLFIAEDESSILIVGLSAAKSSGDSLTYRLRGASDGLLAAWRTSYPELSLSWTGEASVNADLRRLSAASTRMAELRVLPLTLIVLAAAFRGLLAAALPILCGALTILVSMAALAILNRFWPVSLIALSIISMVGLGLSIDYALLMLSRYRELTAGMARAAAAIEAAAQAGHTVIASGSAIAVGFGAMLIVPVSEVRSIGVAGLVVTSVAVLVAVTLLPAALIRIGPWIDAARPGKGGNGQTAQRWRRWAGWVTRRPWQVLIVASVPLLLLAAQALNFRIDLPRGRWLPESAESVRVLHEIDAVARGNFGQIIDIVLELPPGAPLQTEAGWRATSRLVRHYARDPRIQHVWAISTVTVKPLAGPEILEQIPRPLRDSLVTPDGRAVLLQLLPKQALAPTDAAAMVREIRAADAQALTGLAGTVLKVGGVPAFNIDYQDTVQHSLGLLAALVVCVTLLVLSVTFRSVLIPLKAVALNLLSVAAAFGATTLVFQSEWGSRLLGLPRALRGGFPIVPILVFCIVFGLSMDYEVFLVARIADGRRAGLSDTQALIEAVSSMGRVITFAAAIMILIFGGFMCGEFVLIKILGFALGVAVLIEATLIRLALGPALMQLAGRWNWWPGRISGPALRALQAALHAVQPEDRGRE